MPKEQKYDAVGFFWKANFSAIISITNSESMIGTIENIKASNEIECLWIIIVEQRKLAKLLIEIIQILKSKTVGNEIPEKACER